MIAWGEKKGRCYKCIGNVLFNETFFQRRIYTHFHFHKAIGYSVNRLIALSFVLVLLAQAGAYVLRTALFSHLLSPKRRSSRKIYISLMPSFVALSTRNRSSKSAARLSFPWSLSICLSFGKIKFEFLREQFIIVLSTSVVRHLIFNKISDTC